MQHVILLKDHPQPHHLTKYEGKGTKISIFKLFSELGKIWKCNLGFSKIPISYLLWIGKNLEIYTAPDQHFKIPMLNLWMSWENLSFPVENKTENSHKREWSNFKLKINDSDIPFPNMLRICQLIVKNHFHWRKWTEPIKSITQCVRLKIKM